MSDFSEERLNALEAATIRETRYHAEVLVLLDAVRALREENAALQEALSRATMCATVTDVAPEDVVRVDEPRVE